MKKAAPEQGWAVSIQLNGLPILTIGHDYLSGIPDIADHAELVRKCARHLLSFIGEEDEPATFIDSDIPF